MKADKRIGFAIMTPHVVLTIQFFLINYVGIADSPLLGKVQLLSKGVVAVVMMTAFLPVIKRTAKKWVVVYSIALFLFLINYLLFPQNAEFLKRVGLENLIICLPLFLYSYSLNDWLIFRRVMRTASKIILLTGVVLFTLVGSGKMTVGSYSMSLSYYILIPAVFYADEFMRTYTLRAFFTTSLAVIVIISLGARGPLLCLAVFVLITYIQKFLGIIKKGGKAKRKNVVAFLSISLVFIGALIFHRQILMFLGGYLAKFGIRSRTISLFLTNITYSSGRIGIYREVLHALWENPIMGIGLAGDRVLVGGYAHNIFIEILSGFGLILGSILIFVLMAFLLKSLFRQDASQTNLLTMWFALGFVPLLVSGSYITNFNFWIYLGLSFKFSRIAIHRDNSRFPIFKERQNVSIT